MATVPFRVEGSGEGEVPDCKLVTPTYPPPSRVRYLSCDPAASCGELQVKKATAYRDRDYISYCCKSPELNNI